MANGATGGQSGLAQISGIPAASSSTPVWLKLVNSLPSGEPSRGLGEGQGVGRFHRLLFFGGATWTEVGLVAVTFSNTNYLSGLCVSSTAAGSLSTATFDNLTSGASATNNLALNTAVTDSSELPSTSGGGAGGEGGSSGDNAVDGNASTAWTSAAGGTQWLEVDMGATRPSTRSNSIGRAYASAIRFRSRPTRKTGPRSTPRPPAKAASRT